MLVKSVTSTKMLRIIHDISVCVYVLSFTIFSKVLQEIDQLKLEAEENSTWLRVARGL